MAIANARLAVRNYERGLRVSSALGLPSPNKLPPSLLPLVNPAQSVLLPLLSSLPFARANARKVVTSGKALPLFFPRHELGYVYSGECVVDECGGGGEGEGRERERDLEDETYVQSSAPGCRLPHHWLRAAGGEVLSTHDALHSTSAPFTMPNGRPPTLTLLVDAQERRTWKHALLASRAKYVSLVAVGRELSEGDSSLLCDEEGGWEEKRGVEPSGALLVRPDGHVAWRCRSLQPPRETHAAEALAAALHALKWS